MLSGALDRGILLPDELWAEVFCHLQPEVHVDPTTADMVETPFVAEEHRQFTGYVLCANVSIKYSISIKNW